MTDRVISEDLLQIISNYIAMGSISKGMSWAEMQIMLDRLQKLEPVEQSGPKLVKGKADVPNG